MKISPLFVVMFLALYCVGGYYAFSYKPASAKTVQDQPFLKCVSGSTWYLVEDYEIDGVELLDLKRGQFFNAMRCQGYR